MALKLNVGVSQKVGLRDYGSAGASCNLELELSGSLLGDPDTFQQQVRQAFTACRLAVQQELARHQDTNTATTDGHAPASVTTPRSPQNGNGHHASEKQLTYARQLAGQIDGLGVRKLETLAQKMFAKPFAGLTSLDASGLIDVLKDIKSGKIDLAAALNGAAT